MYQLGYLFHLSSCVVTPYVLGLMLWLPCGPDSSWSDDPKLVGHLLVLSHPFTLHQLQPSNALLCSHSEVSDLSLGRACSGVPYVIRKVPGL